MRPRINRPWDRTIHSDNHSLCTTEGLQRIVPAFEKVACWQTSWSCPEPARVLGRKDHQISHTVGSDLPEGRAKWMSKLLLWGNGFAADHHLRVSHIVVEPLNLQAALPAFPVSRGAVKRCQSRCIGDYIRQCNSNFSMLGERSRAPSSIGASYFGHGYSYVRAPKSPHQQWVSRAYFGHRDQQASAKINPHYFLFWKWISEDSYFPAVRYAMYRIRV